MSHRWFIEPREPIVVREGRSAGALEDHSEVLLPLPNTIAGLVRACFVEDTTRVDPDELLGIRIDDGPWFGCWNGVDSFDAYVPAPDDAVCGVFGGVESFRRARLVSSKGAILLWPTKSPPLAHLVLPPERGDGGTKTTRAADIRKHRYWTLDRAVSWSTSPVNDVPLAAYPPIEPIEYETRIHVSMDDCTGTAEQGMLYGTPGLRFREGFGFGLGLSGVPERLAGVDVSRMVFLGGEGRSSVRHDIDDVLPRFSTYQQYYETAGENHPTGLRLQLMTPAWLSPDALPSEPGWLPSWWQSGEHPALPVGIRLHLVAACLPRAIGISGWDLQWQGRGGPRVVRRLARAGSIYYFELHDEKGNAIKSPDAFLEVAAKLWAQPIEMPAANSERSEKLRQQHLAPPAHDGFGRVLPGYFWTNKDSVS